MKEVSDFFVYLYQVLNRLPSTIDGYRTAIVDTLGPAGLHILQAQTLTGYTPVFSGIVPKFQESSKMEPFSVVLNELAKAPFDPMKDTDLQHVSQSAFLLALASGKRCSKIHAWVANKHLI